MKDSSEPLTTVSRRLAIFAGFAAFFVMEKSLRVLGGGDEGSSHGHSHSHDTPSAKSSGISSTAQQNGSRTRRSKKADAANGRQEKEAHTPPAANAPSKLSAYLNLFGDFVHNM
jgi:solute carrier family 39 (zinc transporter), member 7